MVEAGYGRGESQGVSDESFAGTGRDVDCGMRNLGESLRLGLCVEADTICVRV